MPWGNALNQNRISGLVRVREKITLQSIALSFRSDFVDLIGLNRKRSLSYTEDSERKERKRWLENEMRECKVVFLRTLSNA